MQIIEQPASLGGLFHALKNNGILTQLFFRIRSNYLRIAFFAAAARANAPQQATNTIPLLLTLWLDRKKIMTERKFEKVLGIILLWMLGYVLMWAAKWFISWLALGNEVWGDVGNQIGLRSFRGEAGLSTLELLSYSFKQNIENLFPFCLGDTFKVATIIIALVFGIFSIKNRKQRIGWFWIVAVIIVGLLPILRIALLTEHGARHYFFTYRALTASIMALIMLFAGIIKRKSSIRKT